MMKRALVFCLALGCKDDPGARPSATVPAAAGSSSAAAAAPETTKPASEKLPSCDDPNIDFKLAGTPRERVEARFGAPTERESYRADDVGGEFYVAIEWTYPNSDPKNADVPIEEWTWHSGDCRLTVWFHKPRGDWEVLDDVFYDRRTQF